jgi:hypothetical protein
MHALLVQLEIDPKRAEGAVDFLHQTVIPMISSGAGFVRGMWMRSERRAQHPQPDRLRQQGSRGTGGRPCTAGTAAGSADQVRVR